jgi:hypothetical protein
MDVLDGKVFTTLYINTCWVTTQKCPCVRYKWYTTLYNFMLGQNTTNAHVLDIRDSPHCIQLHAGSQHKKCPCVRWIWPIHRHVFPLPLPVGYEEGYTWSGSPFTICHTRKSKQHTDGYGMVLLMLRLKTWVNIRKDWCEHLSIMNDEMSSWMTPLDGWWHSVALINSIKRTSYR